MISLLRTSKERSYKGSDKEDMLMTDKRKTNTLPRIGMNKGETGKTEAQNFGNASVRWTCNTGCIKVSLENI
eukprot:11589103-Heterocapsa_arctica.AAC.1